MTPNLHAVLVENVSGVGGYVFGLRFLGLLVDVDLVDGDAAFKGVLQLGDDGHHALAVGAPGCKELYKYFWFAVD